MYDKKAKPLRACVPVDPFESAPRDQGGGGGRMKPITKENVAGRPLISVPKVNDRHPSLAKINPAFNRAGARNKHNAVHDEMCLTGRNNRRRKTGGCVTGAKSLSLLLHRGKYQYFVEDAFGHVVTASLRVTAPNCYNIAITRDTELSGWCYFARHGSAR